MTWLKEALLQDAPTSEPSPTTNAFIGPDGTFYPIQEDHGHDRWIWMYLKDEPGDIGKPWIRQKAFDKLIFEYSWRPTDAQWVTMAKVVLSADGYSQVIINDMNAGSGSFSVSEFRSSGLPLKEYLESIW